MSDPFRTGSTLAERLARVRSSIADAARDAQRRPDSITTVVVTKFHPARLVRELVELGVSDIGENRHQEAAAKAAELSDLPITWHFVGQLQSNKAAAVSSYAHVIHSVDRPSVVEALLAAQRPIDAFIQLNLTDDPHRGGVRFGDLPSFAERVLAANGIRLRGLMAVAPVEGDARRAFAEVRLASESLRRLAPDATALSMGMSGDYREAILEGATHLRIGTAITGNRPEHG
jgi:PLP dependent protein